MRTDFVAVASEQVHDGAPELLLADVGVGVVVDAAGFLERGGRRERSVVGLVYRTSVDENEKSTPDRREAHSGDFTVEILARALGEQVAESILCYAFTWYLWRFTKRQRTTSTASGG